MNQIRIGLVGLSVMAMFLFGCGSGGFTGEYASSGGEFVFVFEGDDGTVEITHNVEGYDGNVIGSNSLEATFDYDAGKDKLIIESSTARPKEVFTINRDGTITGSGVKLYPVVNADFLKGGYWMSTWELESGDIEYIDLTKYEGNNNRQLKSITNTVVLDHERGWYAMFDDIVTTTCSTDDEINLFTCRDENESEGRGEEYPLKAVKPTKESITFIISPGSFSAPEYTAVHYAEKPDFPIPAGYEKHTAEEIFE